MPGASSARRAAAMKEVRSRSRERGDGALGPVADAALGLVEDAAQVDVVVRVDQHAQVGEGVLDFLALVEAGAADHLVGQPDADQDVLDGPGLGVGAVEDRDVAGTEVALVLQPVDFLGDELGLVVLVLADVADDLLAVALGRPEPLLRPVRVAGDHRVGGAEDGLGGAVVLLELDGAGVRVVLLELHDVADVRAAEGVDGLVRVADDRQFGRVRGALADDLARPGRTGRGWCPGTRPPARAGSGAGRSRRAPGRPGTCRRSRRSGRRSPSRWPGAGAACSP